jgi:hypothetical protein
MSPVMRRGILTSAYESALAKLTVAVRQFGLHHDAVRDVVGGHDPVRLNGKRSTPMRRLSSARRRNADYSAVEHIS